MLPQNLLKSSISLLQRAYEPLNRIEISQSAVLHNFDLLKSLAGAEYVLPVLKSNAYGHGIKEIATILKERSFPYIAVDGYHEALEVSRWSNQSVLVMGAILPENLPKLDFRRYSYGVQDIETLADFGRLSRPIKIHLEINTGMNRQGVDPEEIGAVIELLHEYPKLELEGVFTHLASADDIDNRFTEHQVREYDRCVESLLRAGLKPRYFHIANSPGTAKVKSKFVNAIRPGISFYGINVLDPKDVNYKKMLVLKPALSMHSRIIKLRDLKPGDTVSYNRTFTAKKQTKSAVIPAGYHEGISRELSNKGELSVNGDKTPVIGRVCMNHTVLDVSKVKDVKLWDEVIVISRNRDDPNSIENLSHTSGTLAYLLPEKIANDVRRIVVD